MTSRTLLLGAALLAVFLLPSRSLAQQNTVSVHFGADVVSRYVVRGLNFGQSPSLQPSAVVSAAGFDLGTWGNYGLTSTDGGNGAEQDFWLGYTLQRDDLGSLRLGLFDFHFPEAGPGFFDTSGGGEGGHFVEAQLRLAPARLPVYLFAGHHVHNDPDGSWYVEAGYTPRLGELDVALAAGVAGGESAWYRTQGRGLSLINTSVRLARAVQLTDEFALPLHATFVLNPTTERAYLVFGLSL